MTSVSLSLQNHDKKELDLKEKTGGTISEQDSRFIYKFIEENSKENVSSTKNYL